MGGRGSNQAAGLHLPRPAGALAGEDHLALEVGERIGDGRVVRLPDQTGDLRRGDRPERRHRLHRAEGQVVPATAVCRGRE